MIPANDTLDVRFRQHEGELERHEIRRLIEEHRQSQSVWTRIFHALRNGDGLTKASGVATVLSGFVLLAVMI